MGFQDAVIASADIVHIDLCMYTCELVAVSLCQVRDLKAWHALPLLHSRKLQAHVALHTKPLDHGQGEGRPASLFVHIRTCTRYIKYKVLR